MGLSTQQKAYIPRRNGATLFRWIEDSIELGQAEERSLGWIPPAIRRSPHASERAALAFGPFGAPFKPRVAKRNSPLTIPIEISKIYDT